MSRFRKKSMLFIAAALLMAAQQQSLAGSATWATHPSNGDWNTAGNWIPATVPNGLTDVATFRSSTVTGVTVSPTVEVSSVNFAPGAPSFNISVEGIGINLFISGRGIMNKSGVFQSFTANGGQSAIFFENTATAGNMTSFSGDAPQFIFYNTSSAGSASFDVSSNGIFQASLGFWDSTSAADATIAAGKSAIVSVYDFATAGKALFTIATGATLFIGDDATADHATATCIGGDGIFASEILFQQSGSAAEGYFTALGGSTNGEAGSDIEFDHSATAANGTFVINGGTARGLSSALLFFEDSSTAGNATITANGGVGGADGGAIIFDDESTGGTASISLFGNGELDISSSRLSGVTIGSLSGDGVVFLGAKALTIGSNNQSTAFFGLIKQSGSVTKIGTGTLTLSGASSYSGGTIVSAGVLKVSNKTGSATGAGAVDVNSGILGGNGIIAGPTSIGSGSAGGAFLAPALGINKQATLTIQSALTFNSDATYTCTFKAKQNQAKTDTVIANGVIINSGAMIVLSGQTQGSLRRGLTLTVICNTSANPISGSFGNLPEGAIVNVNGNNLQATYTGGDGNDLTLSVVP